MVEVAKVTDTPATVVQSPPPPRLEQVKVFIGDLARPLAILMTSYAAMRATIIIAYKADDTSSASIFIAAVFAGVGALYGVKSWENAKAGKQDAEVKIAQTTTSSTTSAPAE
jgi:hypothetical protein